MRKSHWRSSIGRKGLETRILLAYNTQGRNWPSQEMQDLLGARQDLTPPVRTLDVDHQSLALSIMGLGYIGTSAHWKGSM